MTRRQEGEPALLGSLEEQVTLAVVRTGGDAYGMNVRRELESAFGRALTRPDARPARSPVARRAIVPAYAVFARSALMPRSMRSASSRSACSARRVDCPDATISVSFERFSMT